MGVGNMALGVRFMMGIVVVVVVLSLEVICRVR